MPLLRIETVPTAATAAIHLHLSFSEIPHGPFTQ
jgi:hypothetical protein